MIKIVGVRFRSAGKVYYFDPKALELKVGDHVIAETSKGLEYGIVSTCMKMVDEELVQQPLRALNRKATQEDEEKIDALREKEKEALRVCREKVREHKLDMKMVDAEYSFDGSKVLFYFTADGRVDFRNLVKDLAGIFHVRIELRQIGVRDETRMLGGIGICGRELCCATFLRDFQPVSIKMAKEQNLSLNPTKISGTCGRLMCCLKNEEATYEYLNARMPKLGEEAITADGQSGKVVELDVLRQRVRVLFEEGDSKELETFPVESLTFKPRKKKDPSQQGKKAKAEKGERSESGEKDDRTERIEKGERAGQSEKSDRIERLEKSDRAEKGERSERSERPERSEKGERIERGEKAERRERFEKPGQAGKNGQVRNVDGQARNADGADGQPGRQEKTSRSEKRERNERVEGADHGERPSRRERIEKREHGDRIERGERQERGERRMKPERGERTERPERGERTERPERGERIERGERTDGGEREERRRPRRRKNYGADSNERPGTEGAEQVPGGQDPGEFRGGVKKHRSHRPHRPGESAGEQPVNEQGAAKQRNEQGVAKHGAD